MQWEKNKNKMNKKIFLLLFLFFFLFACVQEKTEFDCKNGRTFIITRVIDGDTITSENTKIRLIGINTPEKKESCFEEAKEFLEKKVLGKKVLIQGNELDRYARLLGNVCFEGENINKKLLEEGFAHYYSPEEITEFKGLQEKAMQEKKGCLWREGTKKYFLDKCIELTGFEFDQDSITGEFAEFSNSCDYSIDLNGFYLKDEATNLYFFPAIQLKEKSFVRVFSEKGTNEGNELFWGKGNVWNNSGDQLFLRNGKGELIVYFSYP